jgi:hypothetical protein
MTNDQTIVTGRCLCGDIRYAYVGDPLEILYCHCESCRRHSSAPVATFVCVPRLVFHYTQGQPVTFVSSPGVQRTHCGRCGSPISYVSSRHDRVDLYAGTLEDPAAIAPSHHENVAEQLPWFEVHDALPRYQAGKSGNVPVRTGPRPAPGG